jgi:GT2 family glycosyltransferase/glycosyltransferase involved in cell wall biosynthesis
MFPSAPELESRAAVEQLATPSAALRFRRAAGELAWRTARGLDRCIPLGTKLRERALRQFLGLYGRTFPGSLRYEDHLRRRGSGRWHPPAAEGDNLLAPVVDQGGPAPFDVLVFPIIDWHFRHQRPQHLTEQLARRGHRVFYFATTFVSPSEYRPHIQAIDERIGLVSLPCSETPPVIYEQALTPAQIETVLTGIEHLRRQHRLQATVSIVHHPFWWPVVNRLSNNRTVYDCLDHHAGFSNTAVQMLDLEKSLIATSDLLVATSERLCGKVASRARRSVLIRNGTDFDHFATPRPEALRRNGRRVIGYYGAIAEWFDADLVAAAARRLPDCDFVLVGSTFSADLNAIQGLPNVRFTGEIPYAALPEQAQAFDVCMIPFQVNELTLNTNPVKVYEYLSMGKPVVSVRLPELTLLGDMVRLADTADEFCRHLQEALKDAPEEVERRREFATRHTWASRAAQFAEAVEPMFPLVSVIVLTHNGLPFTTACLQSLDRHTGYPAWELVLVDNGSTDGTPEYLEAYASTRGHVRVVRLGENRGFSAGNNAGARAARGQYLVFLNNDTYVTPGWLGDLVRHFDRRPDLGLLNPVTNNIGNEARIDITYTNMDQMLSEAGRITCAHRRQMLNLDVCAFFCVMIPRRVWDEVGELDEQFGMGFFEDDDYARRATAKGYHLACAEDVFVHHHLSASFDRLRAEQKRELFERNRRLFEAKWGPWVPHKYRGEFV